MAEFEEIREGADIGAAIRRVRKIRGLSMKALAMKIVEVGGPEVSENVISMWELGKRRIFAEQLFYICKAMQVSPNVILRGRKADQDFDVNFEFSDEERAILKYMVEDWDGNTIALMRFMNLYMALPRKFRVNIAEVGVAMYEKGVLSGEVVVHDPEVALSYIDEQITLLRKESLEEESMKKLLKLDQ